VLIAGALALASSLLATPVLAAPASVAPVTCADVSVAPGQMRCFSTVRPAADTTTGPPAGALSAQDVTSLYGLPAIPAVVPVGSGPTVAIVDAGGAPTLESDLATYRAQYGLGVCSVANGCLTIMNQRGVIGSPPATIDGWDFETALDVEAVAAACPACRILVVQADTPNSDDLDVATAVAADRASYVSMSFGSDDNGLSAQDVASTEAVFSSHPAVTFVASSGDLGWVTNDPDADEVCGTGALYTVGASRSCAQYPATSPYVISVGGTVATNTGTATAPVWSQTTWHVSDTALNGGGASSGCSGWARMPAAQALSVKAVAACGTARATTDLSAIASGFAMYHPDSGQGWWVAGGTSLSAPLIAGMYAQAGNHTRPFDIYLRAAADPTAFTDVTTGSTRGCNTTLDLLHLCSAGIGWDGPTGLGTPRGLASLRPYTGPTVPVVTTTPSVPVTHRGAVRIRGKARARAVLRAAYGVFGPGASVTVRWLVNGRPVATGPRLRVKRAWRHHRIRYVVTATAPGRTSISLTSSAVLIKR